MSLPAEYVEEINVLNEKVSNAQPKDVLQFCANHFYSRLEFERREHLPREAMSFAPESSRSFTSLSPFDGTRDSIQEEDEDVHSPSAPSFRPQYSMGGSGGGGSGRRSHSPSGGGGGGGSPFQMQPPRSGSPFLSPSSSSHLSPNNAQGEFPSNYNRNRRTSVSAESLAPTSSNDEWSPPVHPKTQEQIARLKAAVSNNFLFSHLDEEQFSQVLLALVEKPIPGRDMRVITQGDVGDYFYVVEKGEFDVYVNSTGTMMPGPEGMGKKVLSYGPGGSFGELALMYNAPRAATVVSTSSQNILWALDRVTFRRILMENTFKRRRMYEAFLEEVSLLSYLVPSERSKIADSLDTDTYEQGETIIKEGDPGDKFYFIEQGTAEVHKSSVPGGFIRTLKKGDYFGELALLNDAPRAASIIANSKVKVAFLGKDGFQRLLGPVADIMRRNDPRLAEGLDPLQEATGPHGSTALHLSSRDDPAGPTGGAASKDEPLVG
jgi:cAMP-dependent protein kinase regulator